MSYRTMIEGARNKKQLEHAIKECKRVIDSGTPSKRTVRQWRLALAKKEKELGIK